MMESFETTIGWVMRDFVSVCIVPVIVLLLLATAFAACCVGWLIVEYFTEHRHFKVFMPRLVDELKASAAVSEDATREVIKHSGLLLRQKRYLLELTKHPEATAAMRESMAVSIEFRERGHYDSIVKITDVLSRVAPMLGLLGTLIPLGPGIMALSGGDTETLSASLLTAFDTTSLGLIVACFALVISAIRKRWYKEYMVNFDTAMECVLDVEKLRWGADGWEGQPSAVEAADVAASADAAGVVSVAAATVAPAPVDATGDMGILAGAMVAADAAGGAGAIGVSPAMWEPQR